MAIERDRIKGLKLWCSSSTASLGQCSRRVAGYTNFCTPPPPLLLSINFKAVHWILAVYFYCPARVQALLLRPFYLQGPGYKRVPGTKEFELCTLALYALLLRRRGAVPQLAAQVAGPVRIVSQFESFYTFPNGNAQTRIQNIYL